MDMCVHCSTVRFTGVRVCVCMDIRTYICAYTCMCFLVTVGVCCTCRQTHSSECLSHVCASDAVVGHPHSHSTCLCVCM